MERSRQVLVAQLGVGLIAIGLAAASIWLLDDDAVRGTVLVLGALLLVLSLLLPLLTGKVKLGALEAELREDVTEAIVESGSQEGVDEATLQRVATTAADAVVKRVPTLSSPATRGEHSDIMVCAECGVMARYVTPAPPPRMLGDFRSTALALTAPRCANCGSQHFKLPG